MSDHKFDYDSPDWNRMLKDRPPQWDLKRTLKEIEQKYESREQIAAIEELIKYYERMRDESHNFGMNRWKAGRIQIKSMTRLEQQWMDMIIEAKKVLRQKIEQLGKEAEEKEFIQKKYKQTPWKKRKIFDSLMLQLSIPENNYVDAKNYKIKNFIWESHFEDPDKAASADNKINWIASLSAYRFCYEEIIAPLLGLPKSRYNSFFIKHCLHKGKIRTGITNAARKDEVSKKDKKKLNSIKQQIFEENDKLLLKNKL